MTHDPLDGFAELPEPTAANLAELFDRVKPRLERMIVVRLDPRVRRRVDASDVLQETFLEASRRLHEYRTEGPLSFYLWVRQHAAQKLAEFHRRHLGASRRDAGREVTPGSVPAASSASLAGCFVDPGRSPSQAAAQAEVLERVQRALEGMEALDREVLALRYFEELSNEDTAAVLGISPSGAKKRHLRALQRLRAELPESSDAPTPP